MREAPGLSHTAAGVGVLCTGSDAPPACEARGRVGSEFDLEGSLWVRGRLKGQSHGRTVEGGVRLAGPSLRLT